MWASATTAQEAYTVRRRTASKVTKFPASEPEISAHDGGCVTIKA